MRKLGIFAFAVLLLTIVACHRQGRARSPEGRRGRSAPAAYYDDGSGQPVAQAPAGCEASCDHYLQCRGYEDDQTFQSCVMQCEKLHYSARQHATFQRTDCATAIRIVEGNPGGGGGSSSSSECNGCVWDGSSCIWLSQSNWGAGPYSGAASSCSSYCCGR